jgi:subtilisin family serine protease
VVKRLVAACAGAVCALLAAGTLAASGATISGDWYLERDRAAAAQAELPAVLQPVRVAVIDSGIDGGHPAFAGSIVAARSFVGGSALTDQEGHGTFVAGEMLAVANAASSVGGSPLRLVVAKVVAADGTIRPAVEARAIRWAVGRGARVINLSLGGVRDPIDVSLDTYSPLEAAAVRDAIGHGAVVVAAVGNGTESPGSPWLYADWPAALPHVLGVGAIGPFGDVPGFSNRDPRFVDLAAPGLDLVSTLPRALTTALPGCADRGYSDCSAGAYHPALGTSFAAPQVSAAAALLLSIDPKLTPDQVSWLLERSSDDAKPATGCSRCPLGRDSLTGWGTLDIARAVAALARPYPSADPCATSNDAGPDACRLTGSSGSIVGTLDYWDHPVDVYRVHLGAGDYLSAQVDGSKPGIALSLWPPGTLHVADPTGATPTPLPHETSAGTLRFLAPMPGWYYLEARMTDERESSFTLTFVVAPRASRAAITSATGGPPA